MPSIAKSRWQELSPLLDELLDLAPPAQAQRLQALRAQDPALADDLQTLLQRQAEMENTTFLNQPALPRPEVEAGQTVGAYTLEREIGQGGMGTVWLARRTDGRFDGQVAIKFLSIKLLGQAQAQADGGRFAREGQILARLAHPHIARLLDAGLAQQGRQPYLVLEYVDGQPINAYCEQQQLDVAARVRLFMAVLAAVAHAHSRLILHRDLKPSNILVNRAGEVKLLDFGVAKLLNDSTSSEPTEPSELTQQVGRSFTPQYAAPEQVQGDEVSTATDVYALGVLLFLLLSGEHPTAKTSVETTPLDRLRAIVETEPKRLSEQAAGNAELPPSERQRRARELRGDLDTIVAKALKKRPAERYASAADLAEELRRWMAHEPISARPDSRLYQLSKFVRRHRLAVAAGSVAVLALSALTVLSVSEAWRADRAEVVARQRSAQADDLVGYMLGEFADKLRPIGRLELLDSVGSKALAHLSAGDGASMSPQARLLRAKALTVIGEVRVSKRELAAALEPLRAAQALLQGEPPSPALLADWRKAQGAAAFWTGHVYYTQRDFEPAKQALTAYQDFSQQWLAARPGDADALVELSYAKTNLGTLMRDSGDLAGASTQFQASIELKQKILAQRPQDQTLQMDLANSMSWLGQTLLWQGEFNRAQNIFNSGLDLILAVRQSAPKEGSWAYRESLMRQWLAEAQSASGDRTAAAAELRLASDLLRDLLIKEPSNKVWQSDMLKGEIAALSLRRDEPAPKFIADAQDLMSKLNAIDGAQNRAAGVRRYVLRMRLTTLWAEALAKSGKAEQGVKELMSLQDQLASVASTKGDDLQFKASLASMQMTLARLQKQDPEAQRSPNSEGALALCQTVEHRLSKMAPLLQVHREITRAWVEAKSCLGQAQEEPVLQARAWLASRR